MQSCYNFSVFPHVHSVHLHPLKDLGHGKHQSGQQATQGHEVTSKRPGSELSWEKSQHNNMTTFYERKLLVTMKIKSKVGYKTEDWCD